MPQHCSKPTARPPQVASHAAYALLAAALLLACLPATATATENAASPDEPYGTGPQITEDGRLFAWLYLPGLPNHPELETLRIERSWADDPGTWTPVYTFVWDEDWAEFAALEDPFQAIRYYNYDTGEDTPFVDYFEAESSGRSFSLRARADVVDGGEVVERLFAPVSFIVPGDEGEGNKPPVDAGEGGGNGGDKGGIGQGEHERPTVEAPALPFEDSGAESAPPAPATALPFGPREGTAESPNTANEDAAVDPNATVEDEASEDTSNQKTPTAPDGRMPDMQDPAPEPASSVVAPSRLPGALTALAATAALAGAAAIILRLHRR